jgi:hypothetical protein
MRRERGLVGPQVIGGRLVATNRRRSRRRARYDKSLLDLLLEPFAQVLHHRSTQLLVEKQTRLRRKLFPFSAVIDSVNLGFCCEVAILACSSGLCSMPRIISCVRGIWLHETGSQLKMNLGHGANKRGPFGVSCGAPSQESQGTAGAVARKFGEARIFGGTYTNPGSSTKSSRQIRTKPSMPLPKSTGSTQTSRRVWGVS